MPAPKFRSRTFRRVFVRTPKGRTLMHYRFRKPSKARCAVCKQVLLGVVNGRPSELRKVSKSEKRPERPYGGVLCSKCMRERIFDEKVLKGAK